MGRGTWRRFCALACGVALLGSPTPCFAAPPAVFAQVDFAAARKLATAQDRLLVLDAMTSRCGPCKQMDETTWVDPELVGWLRAHAVAIQLDMDDHRPLVVELGIKVYPTILVFRKGIELDRVVGYRDATFVRAWLTALAAGNTRLDPLRTRLRALQDDVTSVVCVDLLRDLTDVDLVGTDLLPAARRLCLQLWNTHSRWRSQEAGAETFRKLLAATRVLLEQHPLLRDSLLAVAATLHPDQVTSPIPGHAVVDWVLLQRTLANDVAVVAWAEAIARQVSRRSASATNQSLGDGAGSSDVGTALLRSGGLVLFRTLVAAEAWGAAGHCLSAPVQGLAIHVDWRGALARMKKGQGGAVPMLPMAKDERDRARSLDERRDRAAEDVAARRYAALLAAGRGEEAAAVAEFLLQHQNRVRARVALVTAALRAGCGRAPELLPLLDEALAE
ncbi:MAG: thioredoxin family protein [Planctomycetota bacterium]